MVTPKLGPVGMATVFLKKRLKMWDFLGRGMGKYRVRVPIILQPQIRDLISALQREIEVLRAENATLRQEVAELRRQAATKTVRTVASLLRAMA